MGNSYLTYFLFICFILFENIGIAQYSPEKTDLIETTAKRDFNKRILENYFSSSDTSDVIAALLSVSHSEDTTFVKRITELDFNRYGKWISFALGQIGNSYLAKEFLAKKLFEKNSSNPEYIFNALGKLGNQNDLSTIVEFYKDNPERIGIEEAILQFRNRNITNELSKSILVNEYLSEKTSLERKKKILFTLARLGSDSTINNELVKILSSNSDNEMLQLALMNFRIQKNFSVNYDLIDRLFNKSDDEVKIELVKCLPYFNNETSALKYFSLILSNESINENLLIETLKALQVQKWNSALLNENKISTHLKNLIHKHRKNFMVNETIKTYAHLFDIDDLKSDSLLLKNLSDINVIQLLVIAKKDLPFSILLKHYNNITVAKQKLVALEILISLIKDFSSDTNYVQLIINELKSDNPAIISIVADGIDSIFIANHSEELKDVISYQAIRFKDNSDFIEAEISLLNLSDKISNDFQKELVKKLSDTKLYSLTKFLNRLDNSLELTEKNINNLSNFIQEAFNFSGAVIKTKKGIITIKFKPELAPITVGNFVHLAKKNFYDGIIFHRVVPGFVIQAGDPTGTGWGGPGYEINSEFSSEEFKTGAVGIASAGKDTEGSQFFIMQGYYPHLNSRYTLFADVVSGIDVVMKISEDDQIISVELLK